MPVETSMEEGNMSTNVVIIGTQGRSPFNSLNFASYNQMYHQCGCTYANLTLWLPGRGVYQDPDILL